jgi:hypothetical protein
VSAACISIYALLAPQTSDTRFSSAITYAGHSAAAAAYASFKQKLAKLDPALDSAEYADLKDPACDLIMVAAEAWAAQTAWIPGPSDA